MKVTHFNKSCVAAVALALAAGSAQAGTSSISDGDWGTLTTWSAGVPQNGDSVGVVNDRTVTFSSANSYFGGGFTRGLIVGDDLTLGALFATAGAGTGTLNVTGGLLEAGYLAVGNNRTGIVNISGGTFQSGDEAYIGFGSSPTSTAINVTGGILNFYGTQAGTLGQASAAAINVSGTGAFEVSRNFFIRNNSTLTLATGGNVTSTAIMRVETGAVNQTGGTATYKDLFLGNGAGTSGTYNLSGGTATVSGQFGFGGTGGSSSGVINQTGGTLALTSSSNNSSAAGIYNLKAGTFRALGNVTFFTGPGALSTVNVTGESGNVTLDTNGFILETANGSTFNNAAATLTKTGAGAFNFRGGSAGILTIENGSLVVASGTLGTEGGTVISSTASVGGDGIINGNLTLNSGAAFIFSLTDTLTVNNGTVSFGGFGIEDLVGLESAGQATYTLIDGSAFIDFTNIRNVGAGEARDLGNGMSAYFQSGSLQVIVVPEPSTWALLGFGSVGLLFVRFRRRRINS